MATRIYLPRTVAAPLTPASWQFATQLSGALTQAASFTNNGGEPTTGSPTFTVSTTNPHVDGLGRWVLGPLAAGTISGTLKGQMQGRQQNTSTNANLQCAVKLIQLDGTDRGILLAPVGCTSLTTGHELATTVTNAQFHNATDTAPANELTLTSQTAVKGDYLVIEVGVRTATTAADFVIMRLGNFGTTDLGEDTTDTSIGPNPWFEFSATIAEAPPEEILDAESGTLILSSDGAILRKPVAATGIPTGMIVLWPGTAASIPSGWSRETTLDGRYPRGAASMADPDTTGGSSTHTHTMTAHGHSADHTHTLGSNTASSGSTARDAGATHPPASHTHAATTAPTTTSALASDSPSLDTVNHEPPYAEVLFITSDGTPTGVPANSIMLWNDPDETPSGFALCDGGGGRADLRNRYIKGAGTGANGGGSGGSATHSHTLASHTHGSTFAHTHPDVTSAAYTEGNAAAVISGGNAATATAAHTHTLSSASASPSITGATDTAQSTNHEPPSTTVGFLQNTSGSAQFPTGLIGLWLDALTDIPKDWAICDGTAGTPDLRSRYPKGANTLGDIGTSSGATSHTHTVTGHTHAIASHGHTVTGTAGAGTSQVTAGAVNAPTETHTHTWPTSGSTAPTSGSIAPALAAALDLLPPYTTVVFLQWQGTVDTGAITMTADTGTATLAGTAVTFAIQTPAAVGSATLVGTAAALTVTMPLASGTGSLAGTAATLRHVSVLVATPQTLSLPGTSVGLTVALPAAAGTATLAGTDVTLRLALPVDAGTALLLGVNTGLLYGQAFVLATEAHFATLTGTDVTLQRGSLLTADSAALTLTGTAVPLAVRLEASPGSGVIVGSASFQVTLSAASTSLTFTGTADLRKLNVLVATPQTLSLPGTAAPLRHLRGFAADAGSLTLSGAATLLMTWRLVPEPGSLTLTGADVTLRHHAALVATTATLTLFGVNAGLIFGRNLVLATEAHFATLSGTDTSFSLAMPVAAGAVSLAGTAVGLRLAQNMPTDAGSLTLTGTDVTLRRLATLVATAGSCALNGTPLTLQVTMAAASGAATLAGTAVTLTTTLPAAAALLSLTGTAATLRQDLRLIATAGSASVTGPPSTLVVSMAVSAGSLGLAGTAVPLAIQMPAVSGTILLAGTNAALVYGGALVMAADAGTATLAGTDAMVQAVRQMVADTLVVTATGTASTLHVSMPAASGVGVLAGTAAVCRLTLPVTTGTLTLSGTAATMQATRRLVGTPQSLSLAGTGATLLYGEALTLVADPGTVLLAGADATLRYPRTVVADAGSATLMGTPCALALRMPAEAGAASLVGTPVTLRLTVPGILVAEAGTLALAGTDATLRLARALVLVADTGALTLAGRPVTLWHTLPEPPFPGGGFGGEEIDMDPVEVCNEALGELGQRPIFSFDDGTSVATLCKMHFYSAREQVTEMHPWNWTTRRIWLARIAEPPPFGWRYQYMLPPDYIRARGTDKDANTFGPPGYDIELNETGHRVLVSNEERVGLIYTARVEDLNLWSPLALQTMIKVLASRLAKPITGQMSLAELKMKEAVGLLAAGSRSDGREGTPKIVRIPPRLAAGRHRGGAGGLAYPRSATFE